MSNNTSIFVTREAQDSGSGADLKIAFVFTLILLFVELILMFHKHHFYSLLAYLSIYGIFFLNYFDKIYVKFILINLGISNVLDIAWMVVMANVIYLLF